jgi:hypothetical protein
MGCTQRLEVLSGKQLTKPSATGSSRHCARLGTRSLLENAEFVLNMSYTTSIAANLQKTIKAISRLFLEKN